MNKQLVEQWISALRSGEYKQGKHFLKKDNKYCCLGVACNIHPKNDWDKQPQEYPSDEIQHDYGIDSEHNLGKLAKVLVEPPVNWDNLTYHLAYMNDTLEWSFDEIAKWLETHLLPLAIVEEVLKKNEFRRISNHEI